MKQKKNLAHKPEFSPFGYKLWALTFAALSLICLIYAYGARIVEKTDFGDNFVTTQAEIIDSRPWIEQVTGEYAETTIIFYDTEGNKIQADVHVSSPADTAIGDPVNIKYPVGQPQDFEIYYENPFYEYRIPGLIGMAVLFAYISYRSYRAGQPRQS
ncbi:MAG: hypothetical protein R3313_00220 [Candidatus Saccharimonadales bacterium]|nr:hypothetical protein [Candidatus Saccharimonadales bacterium]